VEQQLIGIDVGTTGLKALVIDASGKLLGQATAPYGVERPRPGWTEQRPEQWWQACVEALAALRQHSSLRTDAVAGVGLTGQMHGSVFLDAAGEVVRPAILWNDQRTAAECALIEERIGLRRLIELTGNRALPGFTAPKIIWLQRHEPENFRRTRRLLLPKDYLRLRLTGEYATDAADASGTLLFDVRERRWSREVAHRLEVPWEWLPAALESPTISGRLTGEAASTLGLPAGTPVVAGAGDQAAGGVGSGAVEAGIVTCSVGTSGVVFAATSSPVIDAGARLHSFCHASPGLWHLMGVMLAAGGSFRWLAGAVAPLAAGDTAGVEQKLGRLAADAPPGAGGLLFLPYLAGERTPYADPLARGAFIGLREEHGLAELARAVMEGVTFGLRDSLELLREIGIEASEIRAIGGGSRNPLWRQIQADIFGRPVLELAVDEGPAFGAALLAGVGCDFFPSVAEACRMAVAVGQRLEPQSERQRLYGELYARYKDVYPLLRETFHALNAVHLDSGHDLPSAAFQ
jgi:xylulokinase